MSDAVVVLSGGLDSTTALALAVRDHGKVHAVSFDYGQSHKIELEQAEKIAHHFGVPWWATKVNLGRGGALMGVTEMPQMTYEELQAAEGPSATYVPYRNGTFLSLAASFALELDAEFIYAGMHSEDAHNWAYPDCTPEFIGAMQNAIYIGTYHKVRLICPFTYMTKREIIELAVVLRVPVALTHSCYEGTRPACGKCPTCIARLEAFSSAGFSDPLDYEFDKFRNGSRV